MNTKLLLTIIIFLFAALSVTVVYAKSFNSICLKQNVVVTLKNDVDINKAKEVISKIPQIRIVRITDRNKEWSKMINKYDLPNMENPFKNEFVVRINKKANAKEILNKIKETSFVEDVKYAQDTKECKER